MGSSTWKRVSPGCGLEPQLAVVAHDDALGDVEPQAGALADGLGGEEGVEDARLQLGGDPRPVVADLDAHARRPAGACAA